MAAQVASKNVLSILYQPFLSSTRTKQLTSILNAALPYQFTPAPNTRLSVLKATSPYDIILISRGGKPFAPIVHRDSVDSRTTGEVSKKDWEKSARRYKPALTTWRELIKPRMKILSLELQNYFSRASLEEGNFRHWKIIKAGLKQHNRRRAASQLAGRIREFRLYRKAQLRLYPMLKSTDAFAKKVAREKFHLDRLFAKEIEIENQRDHFDEVRKSLDQRYKGMGLVKRHYEVERNQKKVEHVLESENVLLSKPWILLPEDPVGVWGDNFPYEVDQLIQLAVRRFLMTPEEKRLALEAEAMEKLKDQYREIKSRLGEDFDPKESLEAIKEQLREEQKHQWSEDHIGLQLPNFVGTLEKHNTLPRTREETAAYRLAERTLEERSAWRVED